jgi:hypothetical protein
LSHESDIDSAGRRVLQQIESSKGQRAVSESSKK